VRLEAVVVELAREPEPAPTLVAAVVTTGTVEQIALEVVQQVADVAEVAMVSSLAGRDDALLDQGGETAVVRRQGRRYFARANEPSSRSSSASGGR
jgi:hypothetical protein